MDNATGTIYLYNMEALCDIKSALVDKMAVLCDIKSTLCDIRSAICSTGIALCSMGGELCLYGCIMIMSLQGMNPLNLGGWRILKRCIFWGLRFFEILGGTIL